MQSSVVTQNSQTINQSTGQFVHERWSMASRFGFRLVFFFLLLAILITFSPLSIIPLLGKSVSNEVDSVATHGALWVGQHVFHLSGIAAEDHPTDSRDTALNWITLGLTLSFSVRRRNRLERARPAKAALPGRRGVAPFPFAHVACVSDAALWSGQGVPATDESAVASRIERAAGPKLADDAAMDDDRPSPRHIRYFAELLRRLQHVYSSSGERRFSARSLTLSS